MPTEKKSMIQPVNFVFRCLQTRSRVLIWLYEDVNNRIEGYIIGFDEYMNVVLDGAEEVKTMAPDRKKLGRILLKGNNISLIQTVHCGDKGAEEDGG